MKPSNVLLFRSSQSLSEAVKNATNLISFYPGSFNPPTKGHVGVVAETALLSSKVIVGIGVNPSKVKNQMFTIDERKELIYGSLKNYVEKVFQRGKGVVHPNTWSAANKIDLGKVDIEVVVFSGSTISCAKEEGANVLVRGVRHGDLGEELNLYYGYRAMAKEQDLSIAQIFLPPSNLQYSQTSSSLFRQLIALDSKSAASELVYPCVMKSIEAKEQELQTQEEGCFAKKVSSNEEGRGRG